ncbi:MAG: methyltransferase [Pseudomonadota bacterium]
MNTKMFSKFFAVSLLTAFIPLTVCAAQVNQDKLRSYANGEHRSSKNISRNTFRNPVETLSFFEISENMTVLEISPGGGWYTEILAPYLKDKGKYIGAGFNPNSKVDYYAKNAKAFQEKLNATPKHYNKVEVTIMEPPAMMDIAPKGSVDRVLTFRNTHGWLRRGHAEQVFQTMFDVLKPGGKLGIVQHRAEPGKKADPNTGYVSEKQIIELAKKAGFKLEAKSEINANSKDTKDYEKGVWTLPPNYRLKEQDKAKYTAIGESDRMTLRFVKPKG